MTACTRWALALGLLATTTVASSALAQVSTIDFQPFTLTAFDGRPIEGELGYLEVPENREDPGTRSIEIAVMRLPSTAAVPAAPIVYLAGGPGQSGIESMRGHQLDGFLALREVADVIAIDQRGTGRSRPALECKQRLGLPLGERLTLEALIEEFSAKVGKCRRQWESRGVDPAGYTTVQSADDLEELRLALGVERITLWGGSYGTHLGLAALRRHPNSIDRAILMGVEGPDHTIKLPGRVNKELRELSRLVARSPVVGARVPSLIRLAEDLIERYGENPLVVSIDDPETGKPVQVAVDDTVVLFFMAAAMGDREDMAVLPALLAQLDDGVVPELAALGAWSIRRFDVDLLMHWTMDCASGVSDKRWKKVLRQADRFVLGRTLDLPLLDVCDAVDVADLGADFRSRIESDVPTLFISGSIDGRTPPSNAKETARKFSDATQVTMVGGSHDDLFTSQPDLVGVMLEFLRGEPVGQRRIELEGIEFVAVDAPL